MVLVSVRELRKVLPDGSHNAQFFQLRENLLPLSMTSEMNAAGSVSGSSQRLAHCFGEKGCQVVRRWLALDRLVGQHGTVSLIYNETEVMRLGLHHRLRQRSEIGFPGLVLLRQALEASLIEAGAFSQLPTVRFPSHWCVISVLAVTALWLVSPRSLSGRPGASLPIRGGHQVTQHLCHVTKLLNYFSVGLEIVRQKPYPIRLSSVVEVAGVLCRLGRTHYLDKR
jgi:hypothetical protein